MIIPAVTLWQPWASLVAHEIKPFETRDRAPPAGLIGQRIAIHAAARKPHIFDISDAIDAAMFAKTNDYRWFVHLPRGAVVCTAMLASAHRTEDVPHDAFGNYLAGRFAWRLTEVRRLSSPVPAKGYQRYGWPWTVPESVAI